MSSFIEIFWYIFIFTTLYFEIFLLISLLEKIDKKKVKADTYEPSVTILVPVYNEENTVAKTLYSLLALDYPKEKLEIIVINDGSTDGTLKKLEEFSQKSQIQILSKTNGGKYTALNMGIEMSTYPIIGCLDADSYVYPDALKKIISHFSHEDTMAVTPAMIVGNPSRFIQKMQQAEYHYGNFLRKALASLWALYITAGPFSFFRRTVFEQIGLYKHAHNTEDMEIAIRMQKHHMNIVFAEDALVRTMSPDTLKKLYKQRVRWVSGFFWNIIDYRHMLFNKKYGDLGMIVLPFSIITILFALPFILIQGWKILEEIIHSSNAVWIGGWSTLFHFRSFDPFFINTSVMSILSLMLLLFLLLFLTWWTSIASGKWRINTDFFYLLLYAFISPFWLIKSLYNGVLRRTASWR